MKTFRNSRQKLVVPKGSTDYLIRYTTATLSSTSSDYQVSAVVGVELGCEDGKGQGGLCIGHVGCHRCGGRPLVGRVLLSVW